MRTLLHLSDLNLERFDDSTVAALFVAEREARPDVVVLSGEVARRGRGLLAALPSPLLVVPGGDADSPEPFFEDEELIVASINTEHGLIGEQQLTALRQRLCARAAGVTKIVVTHYPLDLPGGGDRQRDPARDAGGAGSSLDALSRCGADVLLAGRAHSDEEDDDAGRAARRYDIGGHSTLVVRAGGEHSFNLVRVQHPHIQVERFAWRADAAAFKPASSETFRHASDGWTRLSDEVAAGITFAYDTDGLQPTIPQD